MSNVPSDRDDRVFTLVELLAVVAIIGMLAGIASSVFLTQRTKAEQATAVSDLRGAATAEEAQLLEGGSYSTSVTTLTTNGFRSSPGTRLGIEFFPWSNIKTLHDGLQLVDDAGHDTAGVVVDVWHIERAHTPAADLASVPLHRIVGVELDDADPEVVCTLFEDTVHRRRYCGQGAFDLQGGQGQGGR